MIDDRTTNINNSWIRTILKSEDGEPQMDKPDLSMYHALLDTRNGELYPITVSPFRIGRIGKTAARQYFYELRFLKAIDPALQAVFSGLINFIAILGRSGYKVNITGSVIRRIKRITAVKQGL